MDYYNGRQINRIIKETIANYRPPKTYKNKKPTQEEFGIKDIDIELIEKEYLLFEKRKKTISNLNFVWFLLGRMPCTLLAMNIVDAFSINDESLVAVIKTIVFFIVYLAGFFIIYLLTESIKYSKIEEYENIKKYKSALSEYYWWQQRKKKDFWYSLDGRQFEIEISNLFNKLGYETRICKQGGDEGVDIEIEKDGVKEIIQCKAHKAPISPSVARDLLGTMISKGVNHSYLVTLNGGTSGTIDFCKKNNISLWDLDDIIKYNEKD